MNQITFRKKVRNLKDSNAHIKEHIRQKVLLFVNISLKYMTCVYILLKCILRLWYRSLLYIMLALLVVNIGFIVMKAIFLFVAKTCVMLDPNNLITTHSSYNILMLKYLFSYRISM